MMANKWTDMLFLKYLILVLDLGSPATQSPPAPPGSTAPPAPPAPPGSTAPQGSTRTQGSTTTQSSPGTTTPEPPLFQNFSGYHIGAGRADCTGQVADISLVGLSLALQGDCESSNFVIFHPSFIIITFSLLCWPHCCMTQWILYSKGQGNFHSTTALL